MSNEEKSRILSNMVFLSDEDKKLPMSDETALRLEKYKAIMSMAKWKDKKFEYVVSFLRGYCPEDMPELEKLIRDIYNKE